MSTSPSCEQCKKTGFCRDKAGLPIFLALYGIATTPGSEGQHFEKGAALLKGKNISDAKAPKLSAPFKVDANISLGDCTMYTLRPLRGGYVYVYDEAREAWSAYFVTNNAFLEPLPGAYLKPNEDRAVLNPDKKPCQASNYGKAACITILDPHEATIVWIGFSDVEWSEDVFDQHRNPAHRARHMREFNVKAWMDSQKHPHAGKIAELAKRVADFAEGVNEAAFQFSLSAQANHAFPLLARCGGMYWKSDDPDRPLVAQSELGTLSEKEQARLGRFSQTKNADGSLNIPAPMSAAQLIIAASEKIMPGKGAIVALKDPVGIAQELAHLMELRLEAFDTQARWGKGRAIEADANITALKQAIHTQAAEEAHELLDTVDDFIQDQDVLRYPGLPPSGAPASTQWEKYKAKNDISHETLDTSELEAKRWKSYEYDSEGKPRFSEEKRRDFRKKYSEAHNNYVKKVIGPISEAHAAWMKSNEFAEFFSCNFSVINPVQGGEYTHLFSLCVADTQDKTACAKVYTDWMNGSFNDKFNPVLRSMVLNQDPIAKAYADYTSKRDALLSSKQAEFSNLFPPADAKWDEKPADKATLVKVKEFALQWGSLENDFFALMEEAVTKAFGTPAEQGFVDRLLGRPKDMPENTPLGRLMAQLSGPATQDLLARDAHAPNSTYLTLLNAHNRSQMASITISGSERRLAELMMRTLLNNEAVGKTYGGKSLIEQRIRELGFDPAAGNKKVQVKVSFNVDAVRSAIDNQKALEKLPRGAVKAYTELLFGKFNIGEGALHSLDDTLQLRSGENIVTFCKRVAEDRANQAEAQARQAEADAKARQAASTAKQERIQARRAATYRIGTAKSIYSAAGFMLSAYVLASTYKELETVRKWDKWEDADTVRVRYFAAISTCIAATADGMLKGISVAGRINDTTRVFCRSARITVGRQLVWGTRGFGAAGSAIGAVLDFAGAIEERKKGNLVLAGAYLASSVLSGYSTYLFAVAKSPGARKAWILLIVSFGLSQLISYLKESRFHDYLEKCEFGGKRDPNWYLEDERKAFESAASI